MNRNHIDKCSMSLAIRDVQIKITFKAPVRVAIIRTSNTVGGSTNHCNCFGNQSRGFSKDEI